MSGYSAGKAAVDHWVRTVGAEERERGPRGCRVVAVAPGNIDTPMQGRLRAAPRDAFPRVDKFLDLHRTGGLVSPADAARGIRRPLDRDLETGSVVDLRDL